MKVSKYNYFIKSDSDYEIAFNTSFGQVFKIPLNKTELVRMILA